MSNIIVSDGVVDGVAQELARVRHAVRAPRQYYQVLEQQVHLQV